ncbi:hypothetical protein bcgnr5369_68360 [Bacillus cereus]
MGDFKQGILPHWDYMWKDRAGNRFMIEFCILQEAILLILP